MFYVTLFCVSMSNVSCAALYFIVVYLHFPGLKKKLYDSCFILMLELGPVSEGKWNEMNKGANRGIMNWCS